MGLFGLVSNPIRSALEARGVSKLYSHQAAALKASMADRKHVMVTTSTASGKSVCYLAPCESLHQINTLESVTCAKIMSFSSFAGMYRGRCYQGLLYVPHQG